MKRSERAAWWICLGITAAYYFISRTTVKPELTNAKAPNISSATRQQGAAAKPKDLTAESLQKSQPPQGIWIPAPSVKSLLGNSAHILDRFGLDGTVYKSLITELNLTQREAEQVQNVFRSQVGALIDYEKRQARITTGTNGPVIEIPASPGLEELNESKMMKDLEATIGRERASYLINQFSVSLVSMGNYATGKRIYYQDSSSGTPLFHVSDVDANGQESNHSASNYNVELVNKRFGELFQK
jgi:hypothetical protein